MQAAFLINERALRARLAKCLEPAGVSVDHFPTAGKALKGLTSTAYDLVVIHWKAHPGLVSDDPRINELADLIPKTELNTNMLYWEVGLRVMDAMRAEEAPNVKTPIIAILPPVLARAGFASGDELTADAVTSDLAARQPTAAVYGPSADAFLEAAKRFLPCLGR